MINHKNIIVAIIIILLYFSGPLYLLFSGKLILNQHWRNADRSSANLAPKNNYRDAIVTIYAARAYGLRGMFAIHSWIAVKPANSKQYTVYQCIGWNIFRQQSIISIRKDIPDRSWFGNKPQLLLLLKGEKAALAIKQIQRAVAHYSYKNSYHVWPGPNSNTFIAYIMRHSPALDIALPVTAIGKDYFNHLCTATPSNSGWQCSLKGIMGLTLALKEGIEINLLGLSIAINLTPPFLHLPGIG